MEPPRFYEPVPRGLEIRIGEKLDELRRLNEDGEETSVSQLPMCYPWCLPVETP